jgi:hypothetical protein
LNATILWATVFCVSIMYSWIYKILLGFEYIVFVLDKVYGIWALLDSCVWFRGGLFFVGAPIPVHKISDNQ